MTRTQIAGIAAAALISTALTVGIGTFLGSGDQTRTTRLAERRMAKLDADRSGHDRAESHRAPGAGPSTRVRGQAVKRTIAERPPAVIAPAATRPKPAAGRARDFEAQAAVREQALARRTALLEQFADRHGWDDATTDEIGGLLTDTVDYVTGTMARVDAGEDFADMREEVRAYRAKQATAIQALVGEDEFPAFVEAVDMERFFNSPEAGGGGGPRPGRPRGGGARGGR